MRWQKIALGEVLAPIRNKVPIEPGKSYKQITVKLWGKGLVLRKVCDGSEIAANAQVSVSSGNFLISKIDARHGAFGLVPDYLDGAVVSNDFPCFEVNEEKIQAGYLDWFSKTNSFISLCNEASIGSTNRVRLKEENFLDLEIPYPSLEEQHEIVKRLDKVRSSLNQRKIESEAVERDMQSMLYNAFNSIIDGVEYRPLSVVAPLVRRPVQVDIDGKYPELGVRSFGKGTFHKPVLTGADVGSKRLFEIHKDDLLFNIVFAWEGAIAVPSSEDHKRVGSHRFLTCVPDPNVATAKFLRYYLLTPEGLDQVGKASPGGAGRNRTLGIKKAAQINVPVPNIKAQQRFDELYAYVEKIREIRTETAKDAEALIPAMLYEIFEGQAGETKVQSKKASADVVPLEAARNYRKTETFREAVLVGAIVQAFQTDESQPIGNFRLQKAVYFARRHLGERALDKDYLRKAAGPYNPSMRYSGGIKVATDKNWIKRAFGKFGEGNALGDAASEMDEWVEKYKFADAAAWVRDKFKYKQNDLWEILATVDYAAIALDAQDLDANASAVLNYISENDEWKPKVERLKLTEASIQNALVELQTLFG